MKVWALRGDVEAMFAAVYPKKTVDLVMKLVAKVVETGKAVFHEGTVPGIDKDFCNGMTVEPWGTDGVWIEYEDDWNRTPKLSDNSAVESYVDDDGDNRTKIKVDGQFDTFQSGEDYCSDPRFKAKFKILEAKAGEVKETTREDALKAVRKKLKGATLEQLMAVLEIFGEG